MLLLAVIMAVAAIIFAYLWLFNLILPVIASWLFSKLPDVVQVYLSEALTSTLDFLGGLPPAIFTFLGVHPTISFVLIGVLVIALVVLRYIPVSLVYYIVDGQILSHDPILYLDSADPSPLPQKIEGRRNVYKFCKENNISLDISKRILQRLRIMIGNVIHPFLGLFLVPNPTRVSGRLILSCNGYMNFSSRYSYPLGDTRQAYLVNCIVRRAWPWVSKSVLKKRAKDWETPR